MQNRSVLITRPIAQAQAFAQTIRLVGATPVIEPVSVVISLTPNFPDAASIVATSANAFVGSVPDSYLSLPLYAVGDQTAEAARAKGFQNVITGAGRAADLLPLLQDAPEPVVYMRGESVTLDLKAELSGKIIHEAVVYQADPVPALSVEAIAAFQRGDIGIVTVFSRRAAETLISLIHHHKLTEYCRDIYCLCLDPSMVKSCETVAWLGVVPAARPDRGGMVEALCKLLTSFNTICKIPG